MVVHACSLSHTGGTGSIPKRFSVQVSSGKNRKLYLKNKENTTLGVPQVVEYVHSKHRREGGKIILNKKFKR
jgi:hypothetical protein